VDSDQRQDQHPFVKAWAWPRRLLLIVVLAAVVMVVVDVIYHL